MQAFYELSLWILQNFLLMYPDLHHGLLGVTQKSAWFMLHRVRLAMQRGSFVKMGGGSSIVEVDETFIGGKSRNMHAAKRERCITGTGGKDKTIVFGC